MYHYFLGNGEELESKKEALKCPKCGKVASDWNISDWQAERETRCSWREYSCLCEDCENQFDFQEVEFWDEE